jgi:hypothetical protein
MAGLFDTYLNTGLLMEQEKAARLANANSEAETADRIRQRQENNQTFATMAAAARSSSEMPDAKQGSFAMGGLQQAASPFGDQARAIDFMRGQVSDFDRNIQAISGLPTESAYRIKQSLLKDRQSVIDKLRLAEKDAASQNLEETKRMYNMLAGVKTQQDLDVLTQGLPLKVKQNLANSGILPNLDGRYDIAASNVRQFLDFTKQAALTQVERLEHQKRLADIKNQEEMRAQQRLNAEEDVRKNRANEALARERINFDQSKEKAVKTQIVTSADGTAKLYNTQTGDLIKDMGVVAKPTATFEKAQIERRQLANDLTSTIAELQAITKKGGLIDQSTGSGAGKLYDSAAGFFGYGTDGAIAAGKIAPIFDKVLKMVPRFEGPQSDKDTASYKEAAGNLANPAIPNSQKKAAAKEILRLMKARQGQFGMAGVEPTASTASSATSDLERWNNTPSGQPFIRPDGQTVIKP